MSNGLGKLLRDATYEEICEELARRATESASTGVLVGVSDPDRSMIYISGSDKACARLASKLTLGILDAESVQKTVRNPGRN